MRDLRRCASFVYWESILHYIAALLLIPAGLFGDMGLIAVPLGLGDLAIGLVYLCSVYLKNWVHPIAPYFATALTEPQA